MSNDLPTFSAANFLAYSPHFVGLVSAFQGRYITCSSWMQSELPQRESTVKPYSRIIPLCAKRRNRVFLAIDGVAASTQSFLVTVCMVIALPVETAHFTKSCGHPSG